MYVDEMERDSNGQLLADTYPSASGCATACAKPRDFLPRATGADPMRPLHLEESGHSTLEPRARASTPVNGEVSPPSAERRKAFELVRFGVAITDDSQKLLILARQKN